VPGGAEKDAQDHLAFGDEESSAPNPISFPNSPIIRDPRIIRIIYLNDGWDTWRWGRHANAYAIKLRRQEDRGRCYVALLAIFV
jgi:hypothetical protein